MKKGFTLMELLVYMAIVGIVVLVAGQAFSDSTKFRVRTQNMLKAGEAANVAAELMKEDVAQMGAKSYLDGSSGKLAVDADVFMPAAEGTTDKSSFNLTQKQNNGNRADSLTIRRIRYDSHGEKDAVEEVSWYLDGSTLKRSCKAVSGSASKECPTGSAAAVDVVENVSEMKIVPGVPDELNASNPSTKLFPSTDETVEKFGLVSRFAESELVGDPSNAKTVEYGRVVVLGDEAFNGIVANDVTLFGFSTNYVFDEKTAVPSTVKVNQVFATHVAGITEWKQCTAIDFVANQEYALKFSMGYNADSRSIFVPGRDHAAVGLRTKDGEKVKGVEDFMIYPPADDEGASVSHVLRFVPKTSASACVAFTFVNYAPQGKELKIIVSKLALYKAVGANYKFNDGASFPNTLDVVKKENVKAFQVDLDVVKNKETAKTKFIVPVPSNGDKEAL
ncbi:MAG: prepilin-type N-terminal cleavage/methylation domain-containing protein [Fibrobacter sp.]|nr:prepilin-type N-terminal cleavage/methylation domain-containing protein [Fibrobacter sp.]